MAADDRAPPELMNPPPLTPEEKAARAEQRRHDRERERRANWGKRAEDQTFGGRFRHRVAEFREHAWKWALTAGIPLACAWLYSLAQTSERLDEEIQRATLADSSSIRDRQEFRLRLIYSDSLLRELLNSQELTRATMCAQLEAGGERIAYRQAQCNTAPRNGQ